MKRNAQPDIDSPSDPPPPPPASSPAAAPPPPSGSRTTPFGYESDAGSVSSAGGPAPSSAGGGPAPHPAPAERPSLLSSEASFGTYRGFLNLFLLVTVVGNVRLLIENARKYGLLFRFAFLASADFTRWPVTVAILGSSLFAAASIGIEKVAAIRAASSFQARRAASARAAAAAKTGGTTPPSSQSACAAASAAAQRDEAVIKVAYSILVTALLALPMVVVRVYDPAPGPSFVMTIHYAVLTMKIVSWAYTNAWERTKFRAVGPPASSALPARPRQGTGAVSGLLGMINKHAFPSAGGGGGAAASGAAVVGMAYPRNLTVGQFAYFFLCPTLLYDLNVPRTKGVRWRWLWRRCAEAVVVALLLLGIWEQYVAPVLHNALPVMKRGEVSGVLERWLKLVMPHLMIWLLGFYLLFHLWLNIAGEITRYGDRLFYKDWWNATTIDYFWRTWNIPVHRWLLRHVYKPLLYRGVSHYRAGLVVFVVSAVFHEYLVGVALDCFVGFGFMAMMVQIPLMAITSKLLDGAQAGNLLFWGSICLGQPFGTLMYYYLWHTRQYPDRPALPVPDGAIAV